MERYTLWLPGLPPTPNALKQMTLRQRMSSVRTWREAAGWEARAAISGPLHPAPFARLRATLVHRRAQFRDDDNAVASLKPVIDGLQGVLFQTDRHGCVRLVVDQEQGEHAGVRLLVETFASDPERAEHAS